nr:MAG TPA: hypothetical protein [Caudoviricetes sp.]
MIYIRFFVGGSFHRAFTAFNPSIKFGDFELPLFSYLMGGYSFSLAYPISYSNRLYAQIGGCFVNIYPAIIDYIAHHFTSLSF